MWLAVKGGTGTKHWWTPTKWSSRWMCLCPGFRYAERSELTTRGTRKCKHCERHVAKMKEEKAKAGEARTLVEPSDRERSEWLDATREYVEQLEAFYDAERR